MYRKKNTHSVAVKKIIVVKIDKISLVTGHVVKIAGEEHVVEGVAVVVALISSHVNSSVNR
jgi:hypothetical protein